MRSEEKLRLEISIFFHRRQTFQNIRPVNRIF